MNPAIFRVPHDRLAIEHLLPLFLPCIFHGTSADQAEKPIVAIERTRFASHGPSANVCNEGAEAMTSVEQRIKS